MLLNVHPLTIKKYCDLNIKMCTQFILTFAHNTFICDNIQGLFPLMNSTNYYLLVESKYLLFGLFMINVLKIQKLEKGTKKKQI